MKLKRFSLRFNLDRENDRRAWEALHRMDARSINQEIIARINAKEQTDVLKELIRQTVSEELERTAKNSRDRPAAQAEASAEDLNTVFDFLNSFSGIACDAAFSRPSRGMASPMMPQNHNRRLSLHE